ncbi:hypothetical protein AB4K20DRAFT_1973592 [Rhizopus microsporus]
MKYISADDLEIWNNEAKQHRDKLRHFYYSNTRVRCHRTYELQKRKFIDRLSITNTSKKPLLVMCVGDRGLCNGSKIEGFLKYGGNWKLNKSSLYTAVCITNEHNTSQTAFCAGKATHSRDTVSATAIALAGLSTLLFGLDTDKFKDLAAYFLQKKRRQA